jgi:hypothetical protein
MRREFHVRFCEGAGVRSPRATRLIVGFERRDEGEQFLTALRERVAKFSLELHPDKTRLIEFGRFADERRRERGLGRPETFNFLGFTLCCGKTRDGRFTVKRRTMAKRLRAKLRELALELRQRMHDPVPEMGRWLRAVLLGHYRYYGVPHNFRMLAAFRLAVSRLWQHTLSRRSQKGKITVERIKRLSRQWLPPARIYHPHPGQRLVVTT